MLQPGTRGKWVDDFVNLQEEEAQAGSFRTTLCCVVLCCAEAKAEKAPEDCESAAWPAGLETALFRDRSETKEEDSPLFGSAYKKEVADSQMNFHKCSSMFFKGLPCQLSGWVSRSTCDCAVRTRPTTTSSA